MMFRTIRRKSLAVSLLLVGALAQAQLAEPIGVVLVTKGDVEARAADGVLRKLTRRADLFEGDTILSGSGAFVQVRMLDDGRISLKPDTELTFDAYAYDADPATADTAVMSLLRGGFTAIAGRIGKSPQDDYQIDTPSGSIQADGTHEAILDGEVLYTSVYDGSASVMNGIGTVDLGRGTRHAFSETRPGQAPVGLLEGPVVMSSP